MSQKVFLILGLATLTTAYSFSLNSVPRTGACYSRVTASLACCYCCLSRNYHDSKMTARTTFGRGTKQLWSTRDDSWDGQVASNTSDGKISGCSFVRVEGTISEWIVKIDGIEADLGKFSNAIFRKITTDAKQQRFQGFRPGTIPPHLTPTYIAFSMDECAREATLEAMQQNNIRPFENARLDFHFENVSIPPIKNRSKKKGSKQAKKNTEEHDNDLNNEEPQWLTFTSMKEAIDAGWKPGQSFSFVAKNVKGQLLKDQNVVGAKAIGAGGSAFDMNSIDTDAER